MKIGIGVTCRGFLDVGIKCISDMIIKRDEMEEAGGRDFFSKYGMVKDFSNIFANFHRVEI